MTRPHCRYCPRLPKADCGCCCFECAPAPRSIRRRIDEESYDPADPISRQVS